MFIPIGLSMHLAHNTGHLLNESGGIVPAVQRVINKYTPFFAGTPDWSLAVKTLIDPSVLYWIQMALFIVFYIFSLYAGYRLAINNYSNSNTAFKALMPMIFVSFVLIVINVYLLNFPMAIKDVSAATIDALRGGETRPTLSPALFVGKAARTYKIAREKPELIDSIYCYCNCKKNFGQ